MLITGSYYITLCSFSKGSYNEKLSIYKINRATIIDYENHYTYRPTSLYDFN